MSPCINKCILKDNQCIGCFRTIEQITNWSKYTIEDKLKIMNDLKPQKLQKFQLPAEKDNNINGLYIYLDQRYHSGQITPDFNEEVQIKDKTLIIDFHDNKIIAIEVLNN